MFACLLHKVWDCSVESLSDGLLLCEAITHLGIAQMESLMWMSLLNMNVTQVG